MPKFPAAFSRRKSTADNLENVSMTQPSFRVLDRSEVGGQGSFDGGARLAARTRTFSKASLSDFTAEDNLFVSLHSGRDSGSSKTTKTTTSTDDSSRHSNSSTTPSSADAQGQDEPRSTSRKSANESSTPPASKQSASGSFFRAAGRTFSFGVQKKHSAPVPVSDDVLPRLPSSADMANGRARATTESTTSTITSPTIESSFDLDLGGDFSKMLGFDKRASVMTVRGAASEQQAPAPRSLTDTRAKQPSPIQIDQAAHVDPSPHSWHSQHSNDGLLPASPVQISPTIEEDPRPINSSRPSPNSISSARPSFSPELKGGSSGSFEGPASVSEEAESEDTMLLKDSYAVVSKFVSDDDGPDQHSSWRSQRQEAQEVGGMRAGDENMFGIHAPRSSRPPNRMSPHPPMPTQNKIMTPAQFEKYRKDKEREDTVPRTADAAANSDDEDHYDDDDDDVEKAKQQAKQRQKQEARMSVYRQQMMKVTGESGPSPPNFGPALLVSRSTPELDGTGAKGHPGSSTPSDVSDDEEVPLAILAAHGFPNKGRAPTRLTTMASNPNLRVAQQPSYERPMSVAGDMPAARFSHLPAFAKNLPQDPFLGPGLASNPIRENLAMGGGSPLPPRSHSPMPPGGLVGVIAQEERARAARRGSPRLEGWGAMPAPGSAVFDHFGGAQPQLMQQSRPVSTMLSPGDPIQNQASQQMQQFIQLQMHVMQQMLASQGGNAPPRPNSVLVPQPMAPGGAGFGDLSGFPAAGVGMGAMGGAGIGAAHAGMGMGLPTAARPGSIRNSFVGSGPTLDLPRSDAHMRTMSMVQPSSAPWIQQPANPGYAPSIHAQGSNYAPSIAPSERNNIGLPGRYRPVSQVSTSPAYLPRTSTMTGALGAWDEKDEPRRSAVTVKKVRNSDDDDDDDEEQGWQAMKAKREQKRSHWKSKKTIHSDLSALVG